MFLWNIDSVERLHELEELDASRLRRVLRLAELRGNDVHYLRPLRIRRGWLSSDKYVIDCERTNRKYGAGDVLYQVPDQVFLLVRERPGKGS